MMKKVLMVIPFDNIYPPMNGGMLRCFNLLNQLCRHFEVTAIMHQDKESFMASAAAYPALKSCNLISTRNNKANRDFFSLFPRKYSNALRYRYWNRSMSGTADGNFLLLYPPLKDFLKRNPVDYVLLEDMSILNLAVLVRRYQPGVPVIYDAYNVNTVLGRAAFNKGEIGTLELKSIENAEQRVYTYVDGLFTCSENDLHEIVRMNRDRIKGTVVPNGVRIPSGDIDQKQTLKDRPDILFCASMDYLPNREGLIWFLQQVFQLILEAVPDARLLIVGKGDPGAELTPLLKHLSIINYGKVELVEPYYHKAAIAIVPLLSGSGTRLKLLEAMACKTAVVSTAVGAEGITYSDGENIVIANEPKAFANQVIRLLRDPALANNLANNAFSFIKTRFDWNIIGDNMAAWLKAGNRQ